MLELNGNLPFRVYKMLDFSILFVRFFEPIGVPRLCLRAAEAHSSTAQPAGQPAGSVVGRVEQRASDSERERALLPSGCTLSLQSLQLTSESSNSNFMKLTVNFMKLEIKLLKVTPYLAKVNPRPRAKNARHMPTQWLVP